MKKIISVILIITSIMALSSCLKNSDYDYYVEVYDAKTIVGEDDFYKFYLDTQNKKETSIKIVKTFLLNKETCSNEFYEQNKDEYPKTFEIIVSYDGEKYIKQSITEKYTKTYTTFGGSDITATFNGKVIGELQAITYSITREKVPVYTMGSAEPRSFSRGKRGIAGNLVFITFNRDALMVELSDGPGISKYSANVFSRGTDNGALQFSSIEE